MRWLSSIRRDRLLLGALVLVLAAIAVMGPSLAPYNPTKLGPVGSELQPPSLSHLFGTDQVGRDLFSRVLAGAHDSLGVAGAVVVIALTIGATLGLIAGMGNRAIDELIMRITDMFFAFPYMILAMAVVASLGAGELSLILALGVIWWPSYARQIRGHVLSIKTAPFIDASRIAGNSGVKTAVKHVLPQMFSELGVRVSLDVGNVILISSALGFLGLGPQPPSPDWGAILFEARSYTLTGWWLSLFPGLALAICILAFSLFGDALSESHSRQQI